MAMKADYITNMNYNAQVYAGVTEDLKPSTIKNGYAKRLNNMERRLAAFFRFTGEEGRYARTYNDKGALVPALITLTYPSNEDWKPDHIRKFIDLLRNHASRQWGEKLRYCWVAETTKKGIIHYHVVVWHPRRKKFPKPDEQGWWKHGLTEISGVRKGVYTYLKKYLSKGSDLSQVGIVQYNKKGRQQAVRTFGYGGLSARDREFLSHQMLPQHIKTIFGPIPFGQQIKRVKGGWECGKVFVKSNWQGLWDDVNQCMSYKYGVFWTELPDEKEDIWIPF